MKRFSIILLSVVSVVAAMARTTAADAFTSAPKGIFMLLERDARLDMVDYFNSPDNKATNNALAGKSRITAMTPEMMTIEMTPSSVYQLAILPSSGGDDLIALIVTLSSPAKDSRVSFYKASDWTPVEASTLFPAPTLSDWLNAEGRRNRDLVESMVPFIMASYAYDPSTSILTATNDLGTFLSPEIYDMIKDYLQPSLRYKWNGRKFTLVK